MSAAVRVVTGGAGGMGLATARILGATGPVVLADLDPQVVERAADGLRSEGFDAYAVACDVTDAAAVDALLARAAELGRIRSVVHTAGLSPLMGTAETIVRVNALGTVNVARVALRHASPGMAVVLVASMAGHVFPRAFLPRRRYRLAGTDPEKLVSALTRAARRGPRSAHSGAAYGISKNFVTWYAEQQAPAFGQQGSRILSVSPGSFDTSMGRLEIASGSEKMLQFAALPRFGKVEEIAELLAFCASEKAGYLTGTDILCDGGTVAGMTTRDLLRMALDR